jgi:tripartite-type tricarboxylate transporter receptor subunit TctC
VVKRFSDELLAIQATQEFQRFVDDRGFDAMAASAGELATLTSDELVRWGDLIARMPKRS